MLRIIVFVFALVLTGCGSSQSFVFTGNVQPDGPVPSPNDLTATNVVFANGTYVALGTNGLLQTSVDGRTWTIQDTTVQVNLRGAAFGNGVWIAVGDASTLVRSTDLVNWT